MVDGCLLLGKGMRLSDGGEVYLSGDRENRRSRGRVESLPVIGGAATARHSKTNQRYIQPIPRYFL